MGQLVTTLLCLQAKYPSTLFLFSWTWVLSVAILSIFFQNPLFSWTAGWNPGENRPAKTITVGCILRKHIPAYVSYYCLPCSCHCWFIFRPWSTTMYRLFLQNCSPLVWEHCWLPLPKRRASLCWTAEFFIPPSTFLQFSRWFSITILSSSGLAVPSSVASYAC